MASEVSLHYWALRLSISGHMQLTQATCSFAVHSVTWYLALRIRHCIYSALGSPHVQVKVFCAMVLFHWTRTSRRFEISYPFIFSDSCLNMKKALYASKRRKMQATLHAVTSQNILIFGNTALLTSDIWNMHKIQDRPVLWKQAVTNIQLIVKGYS